MYLLAAACLLASASAYTPKYCCTPNEWEADMGMVIGSLAADGTGHLTEGSARVIFDANVKKIVSFQNLVVNGALFNQTVMQDFKNDVMFVISSDGHCNKSAMLDEMPHCIPGKYPTPVESLYTGHPENLNNATESPFTMGIGKIVRAYSYHVSYGTYDAYMSVAQDTCTPITQDILGTINGVSMMSSNTFVNVKSGITDPSVFVMPSSCNVPISPQSNPTFGRRSVFMP